MTDQRDDTQGPDASQPTDPTDPTPGASAAPAPEPRETPAAPDAPAAPAAPAARPRPAFGEYAPEGWEWKPEGADAPATGGAPSAAPAAPAAQAASARVTGVPHNLGAGSGRGSATPSGAPSAQQPTSGPAAGSGSARSGDPAPYRATSAPVAPPQPSPAAPGSGPKPRTGDRIVTVVLLVIGALGALITAQSMLALNSSFTLMADAVGIDGFTAPSWLGTLGTVSALAFIAIYAVTLIFSIQRMRARKLTFWVPLTAGAIVFIAMFVITTVAITSMPELMSQLADPDATQRMLDYLSTNP